MCIQNRQVVHLVPNPESQANVEFQQREPRDDATGPFNCS